MTENRSPYVVFTGGGTLGHLFPGLALAERLAEDLPQFRFALAGSGREFEHRWATSAGLEYWPVPCRPKPKSWRGMLGFLTENLSGYRESRRLLSAHRTTCVVGLGGYASVPMARAAIARGIPLVLLEQNVVPGRATRWLARRATVVCTSFARSRDYFQPECPLRLTGNPVRAEILRHAANRLTHPVPRKRHSRRLLVLGGSLGARSLNQNVPPALRHAGAAMRGWKIIHQSGPADVESTRSLYRASGIEAQVVATIANVPDVLAKSDLVVSRAGGTTLAELAVLGIPAILVPYPHAADDHQFRNAEVLAAVGAAALVDERQAPEGLDQSLAKWLAELARSGRRRTAMSQAMRATGLPDAVWDVAKMVRDLACANINDACSHRRIAAPHGGHRTRDAKLAATATLARSPCGELEPQ